MSIQETKFLAVMDTADLLTSPYSSLSACIGTEVSTLTQEAVKGGLSNEILRLHILDKTGQKHSYVLKTGRAGDDARRTRVTLGLAREALFYRHLSSALAAALPAHALPRAFLALGDMQTGHKIIVLQDMAASAGRQMVDSGLCFGMGSPLNWTRQGEVESIALAYPTVTPQACALSAVTLAAALHRRYWMNKELLQHDWLKGSDWMCGRGEASFHAAQAQARTAWQATMAEGDGYGVRWPPQLVQCVLASISKGCAVDAWDCWVKESHSRPWTLVQGDFHPGNVQLLLEPAGTPTSQAPLTSCLVDWEAVGVGSGPQEVGQYLISHMSPSVRRQHEQALVQAYWAGVGGEERMPWETCWAEYKHGGAERWVWLLAVLTQWGAPADAVQYWADQLSAFMCDHGITADNIGMPRV